MARCVLACVHFHIYGTVCLGMCALPHIWHFLFAVTLKIYIRVLGVTKSDCELRHVLFVVRPSVCLHTYQQGSHWTDFNEICYWGLTWKSRSSKFGKNHKKCRAIYMKTQEIFIVGGDTNLYKTIFVLYSVVLHCWFRSKRHRKNCCLFTV